MPRLPLALLAFASLSLPLAAQFPPKPAPIPSGSHLLTGRVVDGETDAPVAAAIVTLSAGNTLGNQDSARVLTDAQGRFFFENLGAGSFTVHAAKPGWIDGAAGRVRPGGAGQPVPVRDGERPRELKIAVWRYAVITGRVLDEVSEPLVSTEVRIFRGAIAAGRRHWTFVERTHTDDRGIYRFSQLLPGPHVVVVPAAVTSEPESLRMANVVPDSYYQTMSPIGAAPVSFAAARMPLGRGSLVASVMSVPKPDSDGGPWMTYPTTFAPASTSIASAAVVDAVAGRERANVDVAMRLVATFSVAGTLATPAGVDPSHMAVHLLAAESAGAPLFDVATAITDRSGTFTFHGVPAGHYVARVVRTPPPTAGSRFGTCGGTGAIAFVCTIVEKPTGVPPPVSDEPLLYADATVVVTDDHVRGVSLDLTAGPRVRGRIEIEGTAARPTASEWRAINVILDLAEGQMPRAAGASIDTISIGRSSDTGEFAIPSTWPNRYVLRIDGLPPAWSVKRATARGRDVLDTPFDLTGDVNDVVVTVTDQPTHVSGTVQRRAGASAEEVSVLLFPTDPSAWVDYGRSTRRVRSVRVSGSSYSMSSPPPGDYFIVALPEQDTTDWQDPAFLKRAAGIANRVAIGEDRSVSHALRVESMP
jgi:hypothetical protein